MVEYKPIHETVLEPEVRRRHRRKQKFLEFTHSSTRATMLMVAGAVLAIVIANIPALSGFSEFWDSVYIGFSFGEFAPHISLGHLINDFLMALFFLLIGLEIKYEMTAGELKEPRKALLPILGALGGAVIPACVYVAFSIHTGSVNGWGVPISNDIAFMLGLLALLRSRVPTTLRAFLSTMTIADDIIAICVIAIFYTSDLQVGWLLGGLIVLVLLIIMNRRHVYDIPWYLALGLVMWVCFLMSGVHATVAGVLLALTIPAKSEIQLGSVNRWFARKAATAQERYDPNEPDIAQKEYLSDFKQISKASRLSIPPVTRLTYGLYGFVYFIVLPLFAFSNAGVAFLDFQIIEVVTNPIVLGIFFGLLIGKPVGIFCAIWIPVKLRLCRLPDGVKWGHIVGLAVLGGVGFTMAIFITNLAFVDPNTIAMAKASILLASLIAGIAGFAILYHQAVEDEDEAEDEAEQETETREFEAREARELETAEPEAEAKGLEPEANEAAELEPGAAELKSEDEATEETEVVEPEPQQA